MTEASASREVLINLRAVVHKDSPRAFAQMAKLATDAEKVQVSATDRAAKAAERDAQKKLRAEEKALKEISRAAEREAKEEQRRMDAVFRIRQRLYREQVREAEAAAKAEVAARKKAELAHETAVGKTKAANAAVMEGSKQALEGVMQLARGFVLLGVASEDDLKKAMQALAKFQAAVDITKGLMAVVQGTTKAYAAYRAAVLAAAAAQAALNAAQAASGGASGVAGAAGAAGATGAAGAAGAAGGGVAGGVAVAAGAAIAAVASVATVLWQLSETARGTATQVGSLTYTIAEYEASAASWVAKKTGATGKRAGAFRAVAGIVGGPVGLSLADAGIEQGRSEESLERAQGRRNRLAGDVARREADAVRRIALEDQLTSGRMDSMDPGGNSVSRRRRASSAAARATGALDQAQAATTDVRQRSAQASESGNWAQMPTQAEIEAADRRYATALQKFREEKEKELGVVRQINQEQIAGERAKLSAIAQQRDQLKAIYDQAREANKSAEQRFGQLEKPQQQRLTELAKRLRGGEQLSEQELAELEPFSDVSQSIRGGITSTRSQRAQAGGYGEFVGREAADREANLQRQVQQRIVEVQQQHNVVVRMERDDDRLARQIASQVNAEIEKYNRGLDQRIQEALQENNLSRSQMLR